MSDWSTLFSWFLVKCFSCGFLYWSHGRSRRFCLQLDKYSNKPRVEAAKVLGFFSRTCVSFLFLFSFFFFFGALLFKYIYLTKPIQKQPVYATEIDRRFNATEIYTLFYSTRVLRAVEVEIERDFLRTYPSWD